MTMQTSHTFSPMNALVVSPRSRARWLWIESLLAITCWLRQAIRRERDIRRAAAQLESFSDYMLRDIGVARHEIPHAVRNGRSPLWRADGTP